VGPPPPDRFQQGALQKSVEASSFGWGWIAHDN
jgi:hypothetical protein